MNFTHHPEHGITVSEKKTWYEDENYEVTYMVCNNELYGHLQIFNLTKSVYKDIPKKVHAFLANAKKSGWEAVYSYTDDDRVIRLLDGKGRIIGEAEGHKVVQWELV